MYKFQKDQECHEISGMVFGGQPGRTSPVMIGSIGYPGHSLVLDRKKGHMDVEKLRQRVSGAESLATELGVGHAVMLYLDHGDAVHNMLEELADSASGPIFLDSPAVDIKLKALQAAEGMGINQRVVYNSLHIGSPSDEWSALQEHGVDSAVLMAFDPGDISVKGRIYLLDNGGRMLKKGLIDTAEDHGIRRPLVDLAATSYGQGAGTALRAQMVAKAKWGLPCGLALHNTVETWPPFENPDEDGKRLFRYVDTASVSVAMMAGADWIMYGAIESHERVLHTAAFTSGLMAQASQDLW